MRLGLALAFLFIGGCASTAARTQELPPACPLRDVKSELKGLEVPSDFLATWPGTADQRKPDEVQYVFERAHGGISAIYMRALRSNPCLEGRVLFAIAIAPDGTVAGAQVIGSSLNDAALEGKLVQRVLLLKFGRTEKAGYFVMPYPITFFKPS